MNGMLPTTTTAAFAPLAAATALATPLVTTSLVKWVAAAGVAAPMLTVPSEATTAYLLAPNHDWLASLPAYSSTTLPSGWASSLNCCCTNQPLGWLSLLTTCLVAPRVRNLLLATARRVVMPEPQSKTSKDWAAPALVPLSTSGAPLASVDAVRYFPVALSFSAMRSTPSLEATVPFVPSRWVIPASGVTS